MDKILYTVLALLVTSFLVTVVLEWRLVPVLRRRRAAQPILEIGPRWHLSKAGTPTLGGIGFIAGCVIGCILLLAICFAGERIRDAVLPLSVLGYALLCGAIGFLDDWKKLSGRKNQGLSAAQKYLLQLLASAVFLLVARLYLGLDTAISLPFWGRRLELGFFYYPLALLYLTGLINALNLTDGIDGLLSTQTALIAVFFLLWGYTVSFSLAMVIGALLLGGMLGFLCFNAHPARIFMGDTGSLFLGGAVSAIGLLSGEPLTVLIACGVFVLETASVILQVIYFKLTKGKRLLRMAPLHHHFEKLGLGEWQIVALFGIAAILFAVLAFFGR